MDDGVSEVLNLEIAETRSFVASLSICIVLETSSVFANDFFC